MNGPIKIKKLKQNGGGQNKSIDMNNKQSMQSIFMGKAHMARTTNDNTTNFSDNYEEIPQGCDQVAAEIIKPSFRRSQRGLASSQ